MAENIVQTISFIESNPYIIGEQSVSHLANFLDGYLFNAPSKSDVLSKFQKSIERKYFGDKKHVFSWVSLIKFFAENDYESLRIFFDEFNSFLVEEKSFDDHKNDSKKEIPLDQLLEEIKKRPAMYLGSNSYSSLVSFLKGWFFNGTTIVYDDKFDDFESWLLDKYQLQFLQTKPSWYKIIQLYSNGEDQGIAQFFKLFGEFSEIEKIKLRVTSTTI